MRGEALGERGEGLSLGFRVEGLGFRVQGLGFEITVSGSREREKALGFIEGLGFRV